MSAAAQSSASAPGKPAAPWRRIPLSLRLFLLMLVMTAAGSVVWVVPPIYRQRAAILEIERCGGHVDCVKGGPPWLRNWVGDDRMTIFDEAEAVSLAEAHPVTACAHRLRDLSAVEVIYLDGTAIGDADLVHLTGLKKLYGLSLVSTAVTDAGLANLKELSALQGLNLAGTQVTDSGLTHLTTLKALRELYLAGTRITDAGMGDIQKLTHLRALFLGWTGVTDAGLARIRDLAELRSLNLDQTGITDAAVPHLAACENLVLLSVIGAQVTDAGIAELKRALPRLNVVK